LASGTFHVSCFRFRGIGAHHGNIRQSFLSGSESIQFEVNAGYENQAEQGASSTAVRPFPVGDGSDGQILTIAMAGLTEQGPGEPTGLGAWAPGAFGKWVPYSTKFFRFSNCPWDWSESDQAICFFGVADKWGSDRGFRL
jgi:hypothetical protein